MRARDPGGMVEDGEWNVLRVASDLVSRNLRWTVDLSGRPHEDIFLLLVAVVWLYFQGLRALLCKENPDSDSINALENAWN
jgi:hypothetical protein